MDRHPRILRSHLPSRERPQARAQTRAQTRVGRASSSTGPASPSRLRETTHRVAVRPNEAGCRLDALLADRVPGLSRAAAQRLIRDGRVTLNGEPSKPSRKVAEGDQIEVVVPAPQLVAVEAEAIALDIVYEDADVVVVNKPPGMVVHPAAGNPTHTLVNALLAHCRDLSGIGGHLRPGIVHRLDKETSGLLVVAKNDLAHRSLAEQIQARTAQRRYWAIVWNGGLAESGGIEAAVGRSPTNRKKMAVLQVGGRQAATEYRVLKRFGALALVEASLRTGRTHQIRVHFSHIGHPVVGDPLYGGKRLRSSDLPPQVREAIHALPGQALHARALQFRHPRTGEELAFSAEPPPPFAGLLEALRSHRPPSKS